MNAAFRLTGIARRDVVEIIRYTREQFGDAQADAYIADLWSAFGLIANQPLIGTERVEVSPPVRLHPHARHNILYVIDERGVLILRVLSGRQRWQRLVFDEY